MNTALAISGLWTSYIAGLHVVAGQRRIVAPFREAKVERFAHATLLVVWHMVTWALFTLAFALFAAAHDRAHIGLAALATAQAAGFALIFMTVARRELSAAIRLPQWFLFGPLALTSAATFFAEPANAAGVAAAVLLGALALVHFVWALGVSWPARDEAELAQHMIGGAKGTALPSRLATFAVAVVLTGMSALLVAAREDGPPALRVLAWAVVAIFAGRGLFGFFEVRVRPSIAESPYKDYNRYMYSPLCLYIAVLAASGLI